MVVVPIDSQANETIEAAYSYTYDAGDNMLTKVEPFEDDFNDGNYNGWYVSSGTFSASNGELDVTATAYASAYKSTSDDDVEVTFSYVNKDTSSNGYALYSVPRHDVSSGDKIEVRFQPDNFMIKEYVSGVYYTLKYYASSYGSTQDVKYNVRVVCDGSNVKVYRWEDGDMPDLLADVTTNVTGGGDQVRWWFGKDGHYAIDNVRILADDLSNTTTFAVNNANELTSMTDYNGSTTFGFDAWGRMTSKSRGSNSASYGYRYGQMLRSVTSDFPDEGDVTYEYGGNGRRRERTSPSTTTKYRWGLGLQALAEEDGTGVLAKTYVGNAFAEVTGTSMSSGEYCYYLDNRVGTIVSLFNQNKVKVSETSYGPFGSLISQAGKSSTRKFTGHDLDPITGFHYTVYRQYFGRTNRWTTRDPLLMKDSTNLYTYLRNNPLVYIDPDGRGLLEDLRFIICLLLNIDCDYHPGCDDCEEEPEDDKSDLPLPQGSNEHEGPGHGVPTNLGPHVAGEVVPEAGMGAIEVLTEGTAASELSGPIGTLGALASGAPTVGEYTINQHDNVSKIKDLADNPFTCPVPIRPGHFED